MNKNLIYSINQKGIAMDYTYFQNDSGSYAAKRLPSPKNARIKIKDVSDLDELKEELREEKPSTEQDFRKIYDYIFDEDYCYDVDVESFEQVMCANRKKLLSSDTWIKKYWHDLHTFIGDFDVGEPEINEELQVVEADFASSLMKAGVVEQIKLIEYDHWLAALSHEKLPQIKERCKSAGIKITKKNKDALIHELITFEEENPNTLEAPILVKALPILEEKITALYGLYISEIKNALSEFDYPKPFKIAVWDEATDNAEGDLRELLQKELETLSPEKKEQPKSTNHIKPKQRIEQKQTTNNYINDDELFKLTKALDIAFEYEDANGQGTFREFRLDAVKMEDENVYFYGWCKLKNAHRHFRLDRIKNGIILIETGEQFGIAEFHKKHLSKYLVDEAPLKTKQPDNRNERLSIGSPTAKRKGKFTIKFDYEDESRSQTTKKVDVYGYDNNSLNLIGYCHNDSCEKAFRLSGIASLVRLINETKEEVITKSALIEKLQSTFPSEPSNYKASRQSQKQQATGCLVVSVALIGTLLAVPISVVSMFI